ncbi:MAG: transporter [Microbacteriaceae bacterium]|nr:transporter [Microbacteriaceae bacterium]
MLGLGSLIYGFTLAEDGWGTLGTIGFLTAGVVLIAIFVVIESRVGQPLLPLRVILNRVRGGALLIQAIAGSVMIGAVLYLIFHLQIVLGFGPLEAGLASLPMTIAIAIVAPIATKLLPRVGPGPMLIVGPLFAAAGLLLLSTISVGRQLLRRGTAGPHRARNRNGPAVRHDAERWSSSAPPSPWLPRRSSPCS